MKQSLLQSRRPSWSRALPVVIGLGALSAIIVSVMNGGNDERRQVVLRPGTLLVGELEHTVSTRTATVGDAVALRLSEPVAFDADTVVPAGATVRGEITHVAGGGRIAGAPELGMRFTELSTDGDTYPIATAPIRLRGKSDAAGTGIAVATKGDDIVLPGGQRLRLRLLEPVTVRYRPNNS